MRDSFCNHKVDVKQQSMSMFVQVVNDTFSTNLREEKVTSEPERTG